MCIITTCTIKNEIDKQLMTLCIEWNEDEIEFLIMRHGELPLISQVTTEELIKASENFNRSKEEYLSDIKNELTIDNSDIRFYLKDNIFFWKRKIWTRGKIILKCLNDIINFSNYINDKFNKNSIIQKQIIDIENDNEKLKKKIHKMEKTLDKAIKIKNSMEDELYKRFIILLNSKKKRIRTLYKQLHEYTKNPIFDRSTDESDVELNDIDSYESIKCTKIDVNSNACETSNTKIIMTDITEKMDISSLQCQIINDSDDSIELKLDDSQSCSKNMLNITDEDPEEDLFSSEEQ